MFTYTDGGQVATRKMAQGTTEEQLTTYAYNPWGLVTLVDYASAGETDVTFGYNVDGLRTSMTDAAGTQSYTYDALHRVLSHQQPIGGGSSKTVSSTYNSDGLRTQMTLSGLAGAWTYTYDSAHRMTSVANPWGQQWQWAYHANGWLEKQENPVIECGGGMEVVTCGTRVKYTHLNRGATKKVEHWHYEGGLGGVSEAWQRDGSSRVRPVPGRIIEDEETELFFHTYTRNKAMNITGVAESDWTGGPLQTATLTYGYDNFHQLTSDARSGNNSYATRTFTYNAAANRASYNGTNWSYNAANQLTSAPTWGETYTYDRKGNTKTKVVGSSTTTYAYNFEQQLQTATHPDATTTNFVWDYDGHRRRAWGNGETDRWFVYDGATLLAEFFTSDGGMPRAYTQGATGTVGEKSWLGHLVYHADQLGNTRFLTDSTLAVVRKYTQDAFGIETASSGTPQTPHRYVGAQGYYLHGSPGFLTLGIRQYDPRLGRFTSRDPSGPVDGPNVYVYVRSAPTRHVDPSGRIIPDSAPPGEGTEAGKRVTSIYKLLARMDAFGDIQPRPGDIFHGPAAQQPCRGHTPQPLRIFPHFYDYSPCLQECILEHERCHAEQCIDPTRGEVWIDDERRTAEEQCYKRELECIYRKHCFDPLPPYPGPGGGGQTPPVH